LKSEIKRFYRAHKDEIVDIILFGSSMRGKKKPHDIDLLLLFKDKENIDLSYELRKKIESFGYRIEITTRTYKNLFESTFLPRESILSEGFSLILNKKISEALGYMSFMLFLYSLKGFSSSRRMMFHYALNGREKREGIIEELGGIKLANTAILIPIKVSDEFEDFLNYWNVKFKKVRILIPEKSVKYGEFKL
jgi:predicted nucleotidyltransferase